MRTLLLLLPLAAAAQSGWVEAFGQFGAFRAGGDEGWLGSGATYSGAVSLRLGGHWAADLDIQTGETKSERGPTDYFRLRRTLITPSLQHRWRTGRGYVFAGFGLGGQRDHNTGVAFYGPGVRPPGAREIAPGIFEYQAIDWNYTLHGRFGFVIDVTRRLLVRTDFYSIHGYILPNAGVKAGVGYRF